MGPRLTPSPSAAPRLPLTVRGRRDHVITQVTEHPAVIEAAITDRTVLVSIMTANSETGTLQSISELAAIAHRHDALLHTDATSATVRHALRFGIQRASPGYRIRSATDVRRAGRGGHHHMVNLPSPPAPGRQEKDISHSQRTPARPTPRFCTVTRRTVMQNGFAGAWW
ncbi:aminotransferase class V-fold PLP-dependent enzyme [Kribbella sp. NPDC026596]|uniref:aminotransferase class V-fold PLP-dependent enzyme n=1 Tax=Kribbella sp. NPDC026596 TaxID=3155122 RepID=UPI0033CB69ED